MHRALEICLRGEGFVEPNPMVGCVIVRNRKIVGEGWHRKYGGPHAEVYALKQAGAKARDATAYVTLEPCCHFGKTPPCADALIAAGIRRVIAAVRDPNPKVAGKGFARLRRAGIRVEIGLLEGEARQVLAPFITCQTEKRPYVILKWAQSIDGKIATRTGDSKWITCEESRRAGHALRARVDAVVVGIGTVLADDPELTARMVAPKRIATRVVLDPRARTPLKSTLVRTSRETPTLIVCGPPVRREIGAFTRRVSALERAGCHVLVERPLDSRNLIPTLLQNLFERGMTNILVEGGGRVLGAFFECGLADEAHVFVAPTLIGGAAAPGPLNGVGPARMSDVMGACVDGPKPSGDDVWYRIRFEH